MTRLLIIDDSALMRRLLTEIFSSAGDFEVTAARSGVEALAMLADVAPDVITLDINMPGMDGLACLDQIMVMRPCPVVMVSSLTEDGAEETLEAMALGAVDFIAKPKGAVSLEIDAIADDLVDKVRAASKARISRTMRLQERVRARSSGNLASRRKRAARAIRDDTAPLPPLSRTDGERGVVLVGCSTGGPPALDKVLGGLSEDFPWPILVAQHMPASFTGPLARRLDRISALTVQEVVGTTTLLPGHAYIGKGDADLILSRRNGRLVALPAPSSKDYFWHPSVDRLVDSAMRVVAPDKLLGVLMTGMGADGAAAMTRLKTAGGLTMAEAESSAVVWGMPGALVRANGAAIVRPLDQIADALAALLPA
ncbi:chemotaxis-specific protein-glutamate methyltransferase CheB [Sphingobium sp. AP49]|uniref:chemotaxis-specific protein-glutamate methyltransferase CheB n=1 Tax=Sphingobium sp. AP49 TaxID=1144307 RepID=UPI00026ED989|nr:chemotaxis-specific protein-glutamate methyltransferase CheB [Sphingobium sp. AP49]WHO39368.1 chemotaxis-specific protein-glutamate methyltransferase CheB [Sphingobium sp. AP49]